jgi:MFS family permease
MNANQAAYAIGTIVGSLVSGALVGLVPLIMGLKKNFKGLAIGGFVACLVGSFLMGLLLSVPICVVFAVIIAVKAKKAGSQTTKQEETNTTEKVG